jgi:TonB family protein
MHGSLMRPATASNLGQASRMEDLARHRLVVEDYVPAERLPDPPQSRERPAGASRLLAGAAVIGLHASFGGWLWLAPNAPRLHQPPLEPLVLLAEIPAPPLVRAPIAIDPPPDSLPPAVSPTLLPFPRLSQQPAEIAVSISASTDLLIDDASARDIAEILGACRAAHVASARSAGGTAAMTLLVKVEKDGRVSDSKVEVGSGAERADDAAQRCLLAHGSLPPRRINGAPVVSWQRVRWPAA